MTTTQESNRQTVGAGSRAPAAPSVLDEPMPLARERPRTFGEYWHYYSGWVMPLMVGALMVGFWWYIVVANEIPHYILPSPDLVAGSLWNDGASLFASWRWTIRVCAIALVLAATLGGGLAILFTASKWIGRSLQPYAITLQVTPAIAIAPLLTIYIDSIFFVTLMVAWIVAFFPVLTNTTTGLNSADHNLLNLFKLYGANRYQEYRFLRLPSASPYFMSALRISGGLSLIGAVVAEFVLGSAGTETGLAFRIIESAYRLNIPRLFAALIIIIGTGLAIFALTSFISWLVLHKWHESAIKREN